MLVFHIILGLEYPSDDSEIHNLESLHLQANTSQIHSILLLNISTLHICLVFVYSSLRFSLDSFSSGALNSEQKSTEISIVIFL